MNEQQLKLAFMQYLQQKSGAQTQQEFEAYIQLLGEEGIKQEYAQFMLMIQQQLVAARKFGGMLNYIGKLRGVCPEGYEMQFFKQGGQICKKCVQKAKMEDGGKTPQNPVDAFKCGRKMKRKAACGTKLPKDKCGSKVEMDKCGKKMKKKSCGGIVKDQNPAGPLQPTGTVVSWPPTKNNGSTYSEGWSSYADGSGREFRNEDIQGPNGSYINRSIIYNPTTPNDTIIQIRDTSGREQIYRNGQPGFRTANDRAFGNAKINTTK